MNTPLAQKSIVLPWGGELSEEEGEVVTVQQKCLFPVELYSHMLPKVLRALEISPIQSEDATTNPEYPRLDRSFSRNNPNQKGMPVPDIFHDTMMSEWKNPAKPKSINPLFATLYSFTSGANKEIKLPWWMTQLTV